ncbi:hypothetical protein ScPMuIL_003866 [Solemya velum]
MNGDDLHLNERQSLSTRLLDSVKQCQVRFGGRAELATDSDSRISCLCSSWEAALDHGLKNNNKALSALKQVTELTGLTKVTGKLETEPAFWHYVKEHLNKHEIERFMLLKNIDTDAGRGRSWLRASLNEHSLERYIHMLLEKEDLLGQFYEPWSFLRDQERSSMMPMMAAGLGSILFAISIDNPELNSIKQTQNSSMISSVPKPISQPETEPRPVIAGESSPSEKTVKKKKKKKPAHIVSFDEDDSGTFSSSQLSETDHLDISGSGEIIQGKSRKNETSILNIDVRSLGEGVEDKSDTYDSVIPHKRTSMREPSIASASSCDRPPSHGSFSSTDFDLGDNHSSLVLLADSENHSGMVPLSPNSRVGSDDLSYTGEDVETAAMALAVAQKGFMNSYKPSTESRSVKEKIDHNVLSTEELKQAVITMMIHKDEVEDQNSSLKAILEQEMDTSSSLRAQIEEMKVAFASKQEKEKEKYLMLHKENELLKHQLRKYVNAVQMLRTEGSQVTGNLGIHLEEPQPSIPPPKPMIDYSHEASEYEKKLIQVAEMHGELMEFNEMLHKQLNNREVLLKRLQQELITLRGPLPHDLRFTDNHLATDIDNLSLDNMTLINVWIPSAFLQSSSGDVHHLYQIYIRICDEEWNVYKRFKEFYDLHSKLKKVYPGLGKVNFPKKKIGSKDAKIVEKRRQIFQTYLRTVINTLLEKNENLTMNASKDRLIQLLPFFSEQPKEVSSMKKKKSSPQSKTGPVSSSPPQQGGAVSQPEYTGL